MRLKIVKWEINRREGIGFVRGARVIAGLVVEWEEVLTSVNGVTGLSSVTNRIWETGVDTRIWLKLRWFCG